MKNVFALSILAFLMSAAWAYDLRSEFAFKYAQLVQLIEQEAWEELGAYESKDIKCGFGPGEEGQGCIQRMFLSDSQCKEKILFALNQGCKITQEEEKANCIAPPQLQEPNVVLPLNARVSLSYEPSRSEIRIESMICGGD